MGGYMDGWMSGCKDTWADGWMCMQKVFDPAEITYQQLIGLVKGVGPESGRHGMSSTGKLY